MSEAKIAEKPALGSTARTDTWWLEPALVAVGFGLFIAYATFRAFENSFYEVGSYLSPFYSPKLLFDWWKWSPAILILWIPAGFRATCYYYRKAYYRAYFMTPPACAVSPIAQKYCGETTFPLVFQNLHRYFLYLAILVLAILWWDVLQAFSWDGAFSVRVGGLVMLANVLFLSNYTFGCHAFRHLVGGRLDCFSCSPAAKGQLKLWTIVSKLNEHHMLWAWVSLFSVGFTDFYIRMVASGAIQDITLF